MRMPSAQPPPVPPTGPCHAPVEPGHGVLPGPLAECVADVLSLLDVHDRAPWVCAEPPAHVVLPHLEVERVRQVLHTHTTGQVSDPSVFQQRRECAALQTGWGRRGLCSTLDPPRSSAAAAGTPALPRYSSSIRRCIVAVCHLRTRSERSSGRAHISLACQTALRVSMRSLGRIMSTTAVGIQEAKDLVAP